MNIQIIKYALSFFWSHPKGKYLICIASLCTLLASLLSVLSPFFLKKSVDLLSSHTKQTYILLFILGYGVTWTITHVLGHIRTIFVREASQLSLNVLLLKLFNHLHQLPMSYHYQRKTGETISLIERIEQSFPALIQGLFWGILPILCEIFIATLFILHFCGIRFAIGILIILIIYVFSLISSVEEAATLQKKNNEKHSEASSFSIDILLNFEAIKIFNTQSIEEARLKKKLEEKAQAEYNTIRKMELFGVSQMLILGIGLTLLSIMASLDILRGTLSVGDLILINTYLLQFSLPVSYAGHLFRDVRRALTTLEELKAFMARSPIEWNKNALHSQWLNEEKFAFNQVSFYYEKERPILKDISFSIKQGQKLGIVGETGSGKSTISRLLLRFFKPTQGEILFNNEDIFKFDEILWRKQIGVVPQEITLFNDSLYYNLVYGNPDISREHLHKIIQLLQLETLITELPEGLDTLIGERGVKLSGGEKQRIALGRVLLKQPKLCIFDEATSALDLQTEKNILDNIEKIFCGITSVIISHRLSAVVNADNIIVLSKGQIVESGTHVELLNQKRIYASLWHEQQLSQFK